MNRSDTTTSIINLMRGASDTDVNSYRDTSMTYQLLAREDGSVVKFHKSRLGKQDYCWNGEYRYWIWEGDDWRIYVSDIKGFCFEVAEGLNLSRALAVWNRYIWTVAAGSRKK